jgi:enamine deaminase RidA (YjgF/YER057c/UK114 family)
MDGSRSPRAFSRLFVTVPPLSEAGADDRARRRAYRDVIGRHFPAMTAVEVSSLMESKALVEIEATAIVPDA